MEVIFMNTENRITNEPHKFFPNLLQRLDLRNSKKTFYCSKFVCLLHLENYKTAV